MNKLTIIFEQIIIFIILSILFFGLGRLFLIKFRQQFNSFFEEYFIASALGMLISVFYITILGFLGIVYKPALLFLFVGLIGLKDLKIKLKEILWLILIFIMLSPIFIRTLFPFTNADALSYHLPYAQSIIDNHRIILEKYFRYPLLPLNGEILFFLGLSINEAASALVSFIALFITAIGCFSEFYKRINPAIGLLAVFLLMKSGALIYVSTNGFTDPFLVMFVMASIISVINFFEINSENTNNFWFYVSAILMGAAEGTKYTALYASLVIFIIFGYKHQWKLLLKYLLIILLVSSPWLLRNLYYAGNPFWPFIKYTPLWNICDYKGNYYTFTHDGIEKNFFGLTIIWNYLVSHGVISLLYIPGFLLSIIRLKETRIFYYFCIFILSTAIWFLTASVDRYYLFIVPVFCVLAIYGYSHIFDENKFNSKIITSVISATLILFTVNIYNMSNNIAIIPVSQKDKDSFLSKSLFGYSAAKFASELNGKTFVIYNRQLNISTIFYGKSKAIGDSFGEARSWYVEDLMRSDLNLLYNHLKKLKVSYLLVHKSAKDIKEADKKMRLSHLFKVIYEDKEAIIYKLVSK